MIMFIVVTISAFALVFLKGLQSQNVVGGYYLAATITSLLLAVAEVALITNIATRGWDTLVPVMVGGTIGVLAAMLFHRKFIRRD